MRFRRFIPYLILLALVASARAEPPRYFEITFLTTNDIHSRLTPFDPADPIKNTQTPEGVGGAARRMTVVRRVRAEMRTPVMLFDSGDTTYPRSWVCRTFHGEADVAVWNAMGYDAMVFGNHDFEWHTPDMLRLIRESKPPWVCANLVYEKTGEPFLEPHIIREAGGVRIAIFGLITEETNANPALYQAVPQLGLKVLPPVEVAAKLVPELRKKADIVVLLSHLGTGPDAQLAQEVPGIDIILGGHWHNLLVPPRMAPVSTPTAFSIGSVPIVQAGQYGDHMGRTKLIFHRDRSSGEYTLMSVKGEAIAIDSSIPDDPEMAGIISRFRTAPAPSK